MDQEVAKTLGELELKLQELEHELTSIGHHDKPAAPGPPPGKLIDEAVEHKRERGDGAGPTAEPAVEDGDGLGGPAVYGGEELPAQAGATSEREWTTEASETAYGEIPTPPSPMPPGTPGTPGPPAPEPTPTPPPPSTTPPGPPPRTAPPEPPAPSTPPGMHPPSTPGTHPRSTPGVQPPSAPGIHQSVSHGTHAPSPSPLATHPMSGQREGHLVSPRGSQPVPQGRPDPRRPAAAEESQALDLAELVRFRDKLQHTMGELIDEYSKLLSVDRPIPADRPPLPDRPPSPDQPLPPGRTPR